MGRLHGPHKRDGRQKRNPCRPASCVQGHVHSEMWPASDVLGLIDAASKAGRDSCAPATARLQHRTAAIATARWRIAEPRIESLLYVARTGGYFQPATVASFLFEHDWGSEAHVLRRVNRKLDELLPALVPCRFLQCQEPALSRSVGHQLPDVVDDEYRDRAPLGFQPEAEIVTQGAGERGQLLERRPHSSCHRECRRVELRLDLVLPLETRPVEHRACGRSSGPLSCRVRPNRSHFSAAR